MSGPRAGADDPTVGADPSVAPGPPARRLGPYELRAELGRGGMGAVYRAYRADLGREFALKVMLRADDPRAAARFAREARAAAALAGHPGIVAVHDVGEAGGTPYLAMDLVEGRALDALVDDGEVDAQTAARVVEEAARAVHHAHRLGVLHRDIKPANVIVDAEGRARVTDFGLAARQEDERLTRSGEILGTPAYMPPEQAAGDPLDERADVWSLGATLYECLASRPPFVGATALNVLAAVMRADPPRLVGAPCDLAAVAMRCLEKDRDRRYPSALALAEDLARWRRGEPVAAKPVGAVTRWARRVRRRPLPWALGAAALLLAAVAGGVEWKRRSDLAAERRVTEAKATARAEALGSEARSAAEAFRALPLDAEPWRVERAYGAAMATGVAALRDGPDAEPSRTLADLAATRLARAEKQFDRDAAARFLADLDQHGAESHAELVRGDGTLTLDTDPSGARVECRVYADHGGRLVDEDFRDLGATPIRDAPLPMGSYLLILRHEGYRDVRYPVLIERGERDDCGTVRLLTEDEIGGEDWVYVPGGASVLGDAKPFFGDTPSHRRAAVAGFLMRRTETTFAEYLEFMCARRAAGADVSDLVPLLRDSPLVAVRDGVLEFARNLEPEWPALGMSRPAAEAYCAWRSARDGRRVRLPAPGEWERAARGADGRTRAWGEGFSWDWLVGGVLPDGSHRSSPELVGTQPGDVSPFGILDMMGNASEFAAGDAPDEWRCMGLNFVIMHASNVKASSGGRMTVPKRGGTHNVGFRLAADLPGGR